MIEIQKVIEVILEAGKIVLEIYNTGDFKVEKKTDDSPLTMADMASHNIIKEKLQSLYPTIPILSEEGKDTEYEIRKDWKQFWLIDPLDGTKEFIKKNGEFTINIALIVDSIPVLGIIYAPAFDENTNSLGSFPGSLYYGEKEIGSYKQIAEHKPVKLPCFNKSDNITAVRSRSHASPEEEKIFEKYNVKETISIGSSLKFCMVAEGRAHIYYRHGPTYEWDVAAGYAIAKYAGADITGLEFNKQVLLNESFMVKIK